MPHSCHFQLLSFMGEPISFDLLFLYTTQWFPFIMPNALHREEVQFFCTNHEKKSQNISYFGISVATSCCLGEYILA
jgi:hypothetical protein